MRGLRTSEGLPTHKMGGDRLLLSRISRQQTTEQQILSLFSSAGTEVGVYRTGTTYRLIQGLGGSRYWALDMRNTSNEGSATIHALRDTTIRQPYLHVDDTDDSLVYSGSGWSIDLGESNSYGASYRRSTVGGDTVTWTTPDGTVAVGTVYYQLGNGGIVKVEIDNDPTRANLCNTAQQLVDAGELDSAALVANGGTLNPTDRVYNGYSTTTIHNFYRLLADALEPGVHTVRLTNTGYKQAASSATRLYITAAVYHTATMDLSTPNVTLLTETTILGNESVYEYALRPVPAGQTDNDWVGNGHGYDYEDSFAMTVDGDVATPSDGELIAGASSVVVTRQSHLRHRQLGTTDIATVTTTYTLTPAGGLNVKREITWLVDGSIAVSYVAMHPVRTFIDRAVNIAYSGILSLANDDGSTIGGADGDLAWMWDEDGEYAVMFHLPDVAAAVNNWSNTGSTLNFQDRSDGINKLYVNRGTENFQANDVWVVETVYRAQRFESGAEASLAPLAPA